MDSVALFSDDGKGCGYGVTCKADGVKRVRGVCPDGWHLPSLEEWRTFGFALGHAPAAAKDTAWKATSINARTGTNTYGFSALPGGDKYNEHFYGEGEHSLWWAAEEDGPYSANNWYIGTIEMMVKSKLKYNMASYVRCVED